MTPVLHVVFNPSAAVDLRKALAQAGRPDRVVAFFDNLSFGPINPSDIETRSAWVEAELGYSNWSELVRELNAFWAEALSADCRRIVWLSRRSVFEFTGFLEWLRRNGSNDFELVDLNAPDDAATPALSRIPLAIIRAEEIVERRLWDHARAPTLEERSNFLATGRRCAPKTRRCASSRPAWSCGRRRCPGSTSSCWPRRNQSGRRPRTWSAGYWPKSGRTTSSA
jgi:hypothetical protein